HIPEPVRKDRIEFRLPCFTLLILELVEGPGIHESAHLLFPQQTHRADDTRYGARGISAAREADEEDLIARLVVVGDESVGIAHGRSKTKAEGTPERPVDLVTGAAALTIVGELRDRPRAGAS